MSFVYPQKNIKIFYKIYNKTSKKTPMIFGHGWLRDHTCLKSIYTYFIKQNYPVIFFDFRGHGKSTIPDKSEDFKLEHLSQDINLILKTEKIRKKIIYVGHSMGGMVGIIHSANHPYKTERTILLNTSDTKPDTEILKKHFSGTNVAMETYEEIKHSKIAMFIEKKLRKNIKLNQNIKESPRTKLVEIALAIDPKVLFFYMDEILNNNLLKYIKKIQTPVLAIGGDKDEFFTEKNQKLMDKHIKKHIGKILPGTHDLIEQHPEWITREIKQFMHTNNNYFD